MPEIVGRTVFRGAVVAAATEPAPTPSRTTTSNAMKRVCMLRTPPSLWIAPKSSFLRFPICRGNRQVGVRIVLVLYGTSAHARLLAPINRIPNMIRRPHRRGTLEGWLDGLGFRLAALACASAT